MADSTGKPTAPVKLDLLENGKFYSFAQALRILALRHRKHGETTDRFLRRMIRVHPDLSLAFPATDMVDIRYIDHDGHGRRHEIPGDAAASSGGDGDRRRIDGEAGDENGRYHVTATFLGLYGASSPLPAFYTEELIEDANDDIFVTRDFINILNSRFYAHFHRVDVKYRPMLEAIENADGKTHLVLDALYGFGDKNLIERDGVLPRLRRFSGLLTQMPRSASGLQAILREMAEHDGIFVEQCTRDVCEIPMNARCRLGQSNHALGHNGWLGGEYTDRDNHFSIHVRDVGARLLHSLLPEGGGLLRTLAEAARYYVSAAPSFDFLLSVARDAIRPLKLGKTGRGRLGVNSWLFSDDAFEAPTYKVSFDLIWQKAGG